MLRDFLKLQGVVVRMRVHQLLDFGGSLGGFARASSPDHASEVANPLQDVQRDSHRAGQ